MSMDENQVPGDRGYFLREHGPRIDHRTSLNDVWSEAQNAKAAPNDQGEENLEILRCGVMALNLALSECPGFCAPDIVSRIRNHLPKPIIGYAEPPAVLQESREACEYVAGLFKDKAAQLRVYLDAGKAAA